jgi:hypothetical protein
MGLPLPKSRLGKILAAVAGVIVLLLVVGIVVLHHFWPFTEAAVRRELGKAASANVSLGSFHSTYFPIGSVAENVIFQRSGISTPFITVQRLTIQSNIVALLRHHVTLMRAEVAHVNWQKSDKNSDPSSRPTIIDRLEAKNSILEIPRESPDGPVLFIFHTFEVTNLRGPGQSSFASELENPLPKGMLRVSGHFGPWNNSSPKKTELDGSYSLDRADLSVFHSIGGLVSSKGHFSGTLDNLDVQGQTSTPELTVTSTHHGLPLTTHFVANVNGATADVTLDRVKAQFGKDDLDAHGGITRQQDGQRVADLEIQCDHGRIEDTFYPFIHSPSAALTGDVKFHMHVTIPPGKEKFVKKLGLTSTFQIQDARFTHPETQMRLSKIAEAPDQQHADTLAPANFQGQVSVKNGIASFSRLNLQDQDAAAAFRGDFSLVDQRVNMRGQLKTAASLAKATQGIKSVFAKVIEPFFKKRPHDTVVPVKIGGTYSHPQFGLDLSKKM